MLASWLAGLVDRQMNGKLTQDRLTLTLAEARRIVERDNGSHQAEPNAVRVRHLQHQMEDGTFRPRASLMFECRRDGSRVLLDGQHRLLAASAAGKTYTWPVMIWTDLTESDRLELRSAICRRK